MAGGNQGGGSQNNYSVPAGAVIGIFGFGLAAILWVLFHQTIGGIWMKVQEVTLIPFRYTVGFLIDHPGQISNLFPKGYQLLEQNTWQANLKLTWFFSTEVGKYLRWPFLIFLGVFAYRVFRDPLSPYKKALTVQEFLDVQSKNWAPIVPFLKRDLINDFEDDYHPSHGPVEYATRTGALLEGHFLEKEGKSILSKQLGPRFEKEKMSDTHKALFVCFGLRIMRNKKEAQKQLDIINRSMANSKAPNYAAALAKFDDVFSNKDVLKAIEGHYWLHTVLFQMLVRATAFDGVLPPSEFVAWVKPAHRELWYALNRAPAIPNKLEVASFAEGVAIVCQWQAERVALNNSARLKKPFFGRAVLSWKDMLYKAGSVDEPVVNTNAAALIAQEKEAEKAAQKEKRRNALMKAAEGKSV